MADPVTSIAAEVLQPYVTAIDHVGVATADLEATIAFYRDAFGMIPVHREENHDQQVVEAMLAPAAQAAEPGATRIQVMAPLSDSSPIAKFLDRFGPGLQQLALRVDDLAAVCQRLLEHGIHLLYPQPRPGTDGCKINFVHPKDAGGVLIELVEPPAEQLMR